MKIILFDICLVDGILAGGPTGPALGVQLVPFAVLLFWPDTVKGKLVLYGDLVRQTCLVHLEEKEISHH